MQNIPPIVAISGNGQKMVSHIDLTSKEFGWSFVLDIAIIIVTRWLRPRILIENWNLWTRFMTELKFIEIIYMKYSRE